MFRKDTKGFLPELMEKMYADRKVFKKKMLKSKQQLVDIEAEMKRRGIKVMGYLIGGAGEGPEQEITVSSDNPFENCLIVI